MAKIKPREIIYELLCEMPDYLDPKITIRERTAIKELIRFAKSEVYYHKVDGGQLLRPCEFDRFIIYSKGGNSYFKRWFFTLEDAQAAQELFKEEIEEYLRLLSIRQQEDIERIQNALVSNRWRLAKIQELSQTIKGVNQL